tara:strand:- start:3806 stop:3937 length:132 start_codon:yes stop_codon:yes gene_type:complete
MNNWFLISGAILSLLGMALLDHIVRVARKALEGTDLYLESLPP